MMNLIPEPLCKDSDVQVYRPPLNYFSDRLKSNEHFSFTRQMHGLWDAIIGAWIINPGLRKIQLDNEAYIIKLAETMSKVKKQTDELIYEPEFYVELINILRNLNPNDKDLMFGVSDASFFPDKTSPYSVKSFANPHRCLFKRLATSDHLKYYKLRFADRQLVIKTILPTGYPLFDAMIWKHYSYRDEIWSFFRILQNHPVVIVGPSHYKRFNDLANLPDCHHIPIHSTKASRDREFTLEKIISMHQSLVINRTKPPVYIFVAGSVSVYWVHHLHQRLSNKFLIDVGQAFNFLFDSKLALMHREFGYSYEKKKGRRPYNSKKLYGDHTFQSAMIIDKDEVKFDLNLKWRDYWIEMVKGFINRNIIDTLKLRKSLFKIRHQVLKRLNRN